MDCGDNDMTGDAGAKQLAGFVAAEDFTQKNIARCRAQRLFQRACEVPVLHCDLEAMSKVSDLAAQVHFRWILDRHGRAADLHQKFLQAAICRGRLALTRAPRENNGAMAALRKDRKSTRLNSSH